MKIVIPLLALCLAVLSGNEVSREPSSTDSVNWEKRRPAEPLSDTLEIGHTFLSIYSSIYMRNGQEQSDLTATVRPQETIQIVIEGIDKQGGTGANFIFDWKKKPTSNEPFFEAVRINTSGSQGLSFVTVGKRIK